MVEAYRASALVFVAARLGIADLLRDGPLSSLQLAERTASNPDALHRVLRGLAAQGVLEELPDARFALAPPGRDLLDGAPGGLRECALLVGSEYMRTWAALDHSVATGERAFDHVFGMTSWQHRQAEPDIDRAFNAWLQGATSGFARGIVAAYDFAALRSVTDVGGGNGALLAAILAKGTHLTGTLFEQPHVLPQAAALLEKEGMADRCRLVAGDFFDHVAGPHECLLLKSVIHDWDDDRAGRILVNCRKGLTPSGKLLLVERLLPERAVDDARAIMLDIHMLAVTGGRERSLAEFQRLLSRAGFAPPRLHPTDCGFHILEAFPGP